MKGNHQVDVPTLGDRAVRRDRPVSLAVPRPGGSEDLRWLKALSVVLPAGFIVAVESLWFVLQAEQSLHWVGYVSLAAVSVISVAGFALLMFHFIDRAQEHLVRQNHELTAANAVAAAVRGRHTVEEIVDSALDCMLAVSGAVGARIELSGAYAGAPDAGGAGSAGGAEHRRGEVEFGADSDGADNAADDASGPWVELPITSSTAPIGTLALHLPRGASREDCLAPRTQQAIGLQIGSAVQIAHLIGDMERRKNEGHGFYDVLVRISNQNPLPDILTAVVKHARGLLSADESALCLEDEAARLVNTDGLPVGTPGRFPGLSCLTSDGTEERHLHGLSTECPSHTALSWGATLAVPVGPAGNPHGELWIGRREEVAFGDRDKAFLASLAGLATIAITAARVREGESQQAVLSERDRIAREMHDSLAQVLGVAHLNLRVLDTRPEVRAAPKLSAELTQLADMCEEAYKDVREAILGLRESGLTDRGLLANLEVYVAKFSQQSGIKATLETSLAHLLALPPLAEVQIIRVIQEALTNVRKHADAESVTVRIEDNRLGTAFTVEDDGRGFDPGDRPPDHDGFGMYTMGERIRTLGGTLLVDSAPGRGTRVIATVPTQAPVDRVAEVTGGHG